jgi:hypothetical protein
MGSLRSDLAHERPNAGRTPRPYVSLIQYGSQAGLLLTTPHFRHTKFKPFQQLTASVLNRPSQQVRRELALGERFSGFSRPGRSTGPPQKPQESCHSEGGSGGRREGFTLKLADKEGFEPSVRPGPHGHPDPAIG